MDWLSSDPSFLERFLVAFLVWGIPAMLFEYFVFGRWSGLLGPILETTIVAVLFQFIGRKLKSAKSRASGPSDFDKAN